MNSTTNTQTQPQYNCTIRGCGGVLVAAYHGKQHETNIPCVVYRCTNNPEAHRYFVVADNVPNKLNRCHRPHWGWLKHSVMSRMDDAYRYTNGEYET